MDVHGFCVRIDARDGYLDKIRALSLCSDYLSVVGVRHKGASNENPHYHLVVRTQVKAQAFRWRFKQVFNQGKGNGHMSIKPWDGDSKALSYLFHEDSSAELLVQHGVTDETIAEARKQNQLIQREVEKARERASWKLEDEVYEQVKDTIDIPSKQRYLFMSGTNDTEIKIAKEIVLTAFRTGKYVPNDYLLKAMVRRIVFRLFNGDVELEDRYAQALAERIYGV